MFLEFRSTRKVESTTQIMQMHIINSLVRGENQCACTKRCSYTFMSGEEEGNLSANEET